MASGIVEPSSRESEDSKEQKQTPRSGERAKLVERLLDAPNMAAFLNDLVMAQVVTVVGTEAVGFLVERNQQQFNLIPVAHIRNDGSDDAVRAKAQQAFVELIKPCIAQGKRRRLWSSPAPPTSKTKPNIVWSRSYARKLRSSPCQP